MQVTNDLIKVVMLIAFKEGYFTHSPDITRVSDPIVKTPTGIPYGVNQRSNRTIIRYANQVVTFENLLVGMGGEVYTLDNYQYRLEFIARDRSWVYGSLDTVVRGTIERTIDRSGLDRATCAVYKIGDVPVLKVTTEWEQRLIKPDTECLATLVPHTTIEFLI